LQQLLFCCNLFRLTIINHSGIILCGLRFPKVDTTLLFFFAHLEFPPIPTVISTITCASTPTSITSSQIYNLLLYFIDIFLSRHSSCGCRAGDTACTICSVWTKFTDFCVTCAHNERYDTLWTQCQLTSNPLKGTIVL